MKGKIRILAGCVLSLVIAIAQGQEPKPAFLDAFDRVTVWVGDSVSASEIPSLSRLKVAGKRVSIVSAEGRQSIAPKRGRDFVNLPGSIQAALGASEWDPAGDSTQMTSIGANRFELLVSLPAGVYQYKLARGGSWAENYGKDFSPGGGNLTIQVPKLTMVRFVADFDAKTLRNSIEDPSIPAPITIPKRMTAKRQFTSYSLKLSQPLSADDIHQEMDLVVGNQKYRIFPRDVLGDPAFVYHGSDLGSRWTPTGTTFAVWAPTSQQVEVEIEDLSFEMHRTLHGVWTATVAGDLNRKRYRYRMFRYGQWHTAADSYCFAATADCAWSVVLNLKETDPDGWNAAPIHKGMKPTDAVLYEAHIRDLSIDPSSGVPEQLRGKYLGLAFDGKPLQHLKSLGISHVHLLPFQNFNPGNSKRYNWGYETTLFNVPEEQYSTAPNEPLTTIRECKQMVQALHSKGIGVVMDVVYNHSVPSEGPQSAFWETVPYAWFRTNDRGEVLNESGVGNALNDDQPMVRKYICDSLAYWAREYGIDGFRFDLIGMFTPKSVAAFAEAIRKVNPDAIIYGEPWSGGGPVRFPKGSQRGLGVGVFNDNFRNGFRGEMDALEPNFLTGGPADLAAIRRGIQGAVTDFANAPAESISYISCHDNMSLLDRVERRVDSLKLAFAAMLLSEGVPLIEGGLEIGRTKNGSRNSYNGGDELNRYDWTHASEYRDAESYLQGLIAIRKAFAQFRMRTKDEILRNLRFLETSRLANTVAYELDGPTKLLVVLHGDRGVSRMPLPHGVWKVLVNEHKASPRAFGTAQGTLTLNGLSAYVLTLSQERGL